MKENNRTEYGKRRKDFTRELFSNSKIVSQKVTLKRKGIEYTRKGNNLFVTEEGYNKLKEFGGVF